MASGTAASGRTGRTPGIGSSRATAAVDWDREDRKKQMVQFTLVGLTAIFGGLAGLQRVAQASEPSSQIRRLIGPLAVFWVALVVRLLWSFVWFPRKTVAADAGAAAGGNGTTVSGSEDSGTPVAAASAQRRRRMRRET